MPSLFPLPSSPRLHTFLAPSGPGRLPAGMEAGERPWLKPFVHTPAARDPEPGATRKRPLIYVYDLPPMYNAIMLQVGMWAASLMQCSEWAASGCWDEAAAGVGTATQLGVGRQRLVGGLGSQGSSATARLLPAAGFGHLVPFPVLRCSAICRLASLQYRVSKFDCVHRQFTDSNTSFPVDHWLYQPETGGKPRCRA